MSSWLVEFKIIETNYSKHVRTQKLFNYIIVNMLGHKRIHNLPRSQSWRRTSASTVSLDSLLLYSFIIFSPLEKADSNATVDAGMANIRGRGHFPVL
jgi:hypothetical protein